MDQVLFVIMAIWSIVMLAAVICFFKMCARVRDIKNLLMAAHDLEEYNALEGFGRELAFRKVSKKETEQIKEYP